MTAPNRLLARVAGAVMVLGLPFLILGNDPVVDDVFGTSDVDERLQAILAAPEAWDRAWLWFAIAVIPVAVGFVVWAFAVATGESSTSSNQLAAIGAVTAVVGCLIWIYLCYSRASGDPVEIAEDPNVAWWTTLFAPFVMASLVLLGLVLRRAGMAKRGWAVIVLGAIAVPLCILLPLLVPIVVAIVGVVLVVTRQNDWTASQAS